MCVFPVTRVLLTSSWAGGFFLLCSVSAELNLKTNEKRRGSRTFVPGRPLLIPVEQCRQGTGRCAHLAPVACALSPSERVEARVCASSGQRVGSQLGSRGWEEMPRGAGPQPGARGDPAGAAHAHVLLCEQMAAIERNASSPGLHRNLTEY